MNVHNYQDSTDMNILTSTDKLVMQPSDTIPLTDTEAKASKLLDIPTESTCSLKFSTTFPIGKDTVDTVNYDTLPSGNIRESVMKESENNNQTINRQTKYPYEYPIIKITENLIEYAKKKEKEDLKYQKFISYKAKPNLKTKYLSNSFKESDKSDKDKGDNGDNGNNNSEIGQDIIFTNKGMIVNVVGIARNLLRKKKKKSNCEVNENERKGEDDVINNKKDEINTNTNTNNLDNIINNNNDNNTNKSKGNDYIDLPVPYMKKKLQDGIRNKSIKENNNNTNTNNENNDENNNEEINTNTNNNEQNNNEDDPDVYETRMRPLEMPLKSKKKIEQEASIDNNDIDYKDLEDYNNDRNIAYDEENNKDNDNNNNDIYEENEKNDNEDPEEMNENNEGEQNEENNETEKNEINNKIINFLGKHFDELYGEEENLISNEYSHEINLIKDNDKDHKLYNAKSTIKRTFSNTDDNNNLVTRSVFDIDLMVNNKDDGEGDIEIIKEEIIQSDEPIEDIDANDDNEEDNEDA